MELLGRHERPRVAREDSQGYVVRVPLHFGLLSTLAKLSPTPNLAHSPSSSFTVTGVICYKNNHASALSYLASGEINLDGSSLLSLPFSLFGEEADPRLDLAGFVTGTAALADVVEKGFHELINNNEQRESSIFWSLKQRKQRRADLE